MPSVKQRVSELKSAIVALYLAGRHPATPWYAKLLAAGVVAYAFSPIDLIPDFIPVLGLLDDLVLLPLGIALAVKLVPKAVMTECRTRAVQLTKDARPASRVAAAAIVAIWLALLALAIVWAYPMFG